MGVRTEFLGDSPPPAAGAPTTGVSVPRAAVQASGTGDTGVVFVLHDSTLERRAVRLGPVDGDRAAVMSGLAAGERVAVGDLAELKDGVKIRVQP
jgi:hypothetical protein